MEPANWETIKDAKAMALNGWRFFFTVNHPHYQRMSSGLEVIPGKMKKHFIVK